MLHVNYPRREKGNNGFSLFNICKINQVRKILPIHGHKALWVKAADSNWLLKSSHSKQVSL